MRDMDWPDELLDLFDDPLLADVKPKQKTLTVNDRMVRLLKELTDWSKANGGRVPAIGDDFEETLLAHKLEALRKKANEDLLEYDTMNLLKFY